MNFKNDTVFLFFGKTSAIITAGSYFYNSSFWIGKLIKQGII